MARAGARPAAFVNGLVLDVDIDKCLLARRGTAGMSLLSRLFRRGHATMEGAEPPRAENRCEMHIRSGDRFRDSQNFAAAADAYRLALELAPGRTDIRVQYANMLKDAGRFEEAETGYRSALSQAPDDSDIHLQLGHLFKLQGRRAEALESYRHAAELAPYAIAPRRELSNIGDAASQERLFELELRAGSLDKLVEITYQLSEIKKTVAQIAKTLPELSTKVSFPINCYNYYRTLYGVPSSPKSELTPHFVILLLADREPLDTLRQQIVKITRQEYQNWSLRVIGAAPACRRITVQLAVTEPRIGWFEKAASESDAQAECRAALSAQSDWILLLSKGASLHSKALGWFAAAGERGTATAFIPDEEHVTQTGAETHYGSPKFRQVLDYDTLLEVNVFGETIALKSAEYATIVDRLPTNSLAASRSFLLLWLADRHQVGHIPCALVARTTSEGDAGDQAAAHCEAVVTHVRSAGLTDAVDIRRSESDRASVRVRWRPQSRDAVIAVIIPTRDNAEDLYRCVESLRSKAVNPAALQIIVVDNGTKQARSRQILEQLSANSWVKLVQIDEPFNWSRLNNLAVNQTTAPFLLFVNDDIVMKSDDWDEILRGLLERPQIGAVGARLLYPDDTLQHAGVLFGWPNLTIHDGLYEDCSTPGPGDRWHVTRRVSAVTGAFLATRRELFIAAGGLDEVGLPVQYSDIDYALKIRARGHAVLWTPQITCYHHESKSRGLDHLMAEQRARVAAEQAILQQRWGHVFEADPSVNPIWFMATLPFKLIAAPSSERLIEHMDRCATKNPWSVTLPADS